MKADVVIVGEGVIGVAIFRELSQYNLEIILIEKEDEVYEGAKKLISHLPFKVYIIVY